MLQWNFRTPMSRLENLKQRFMDDKTDPECLLGAQLPTDNNLPLIQVLTVYNIPYTKRRQVVWQL